MSDWLIDLYITGSPKAQGSLRHVGNGRLIHGKGMVAWRNHVQFMLEQWTGTWFGGWEPLDEPVEVSVAFYLPRPKKPRLEHAATGLDLDKTTRLVGDALEKSGVLKNDARIVKWRAEKHWTHDIEDTDGHEPGVRVKVRKVE